MIDLTALLWLWDGWRPVYTLQHVKAMARMLRRYVDMPMRVALLTDRSDASREDTECDLVLPLPSDPGVRGKGPANCSLRLRAFEGEFQRQFNSRWLLSMDLDAVLLDDLTRPLGDAMSSGYGFAIQRARHPGWGQRPYCGATFMVECGRHSEVWDSLGSDMTERVRSSGWVGSDQVVMSLMLPQAPTLGPEHGFYFHDQLSDAVVSPRVVHYSHGIKPWSRRNQAEHPELYQLWSRFAA